MSAERDDPVDAACVGETMALLIPEPPVSGADAATFRRDIGGAESNVAIHLARAGHRVTWHGVLGDDGFGEYVARRLTAEGVAIGGRTNPARPTGLYLKELRSQGTQVRYYREGSAGSTLAEMDAPAILRQRPRLVHTTGITAALSESALGLVTALLAPGDALRSFDVNYRPALHENTGGEPLLTLARRADVVFCGLDEAQALWEVDTVDDVRSLIADPEVLVVKQGEHGATAFRRDQSWHNPAPEVAVVEPVGAGDAFAAGFLQGLLADEAIPGCLATASRLAGTVLGTVGDIPAPPAPGVTGSCHDRARAR